MSRLRCFALAFSVVAGGSAFGLVPCEMQYRSAVLSISGSHLQQGAQQKILTKVVNGWRIAQSASPDGLTQGATSVDVARQLLNAGSFKDVSLEVVGRIDAALADFAACLRSAPAVVTVPVTVRVLRAPDVAAGANVAVFVDNQKAGLTAADGTLAVNVVAGEHQFTAVEFPDVGGMQTATITSAATVDVFLKGGDYTTAADCVIDEATDAVVPRDFSSFTVRLLDADGKTIKLKKVIMLRLLASGVMDDVAPRFTLKATGELSVSDREAFRSLLLNKYGPYVVMVRATDQAGAFYRGDFRFDVGRYRAALTLDAPAAASLNAVPVRITNQRDNFSFWAASSGGRVAFPAFLPEGPYIANVDVVAGGARYRAFDAFVLDADKTIPLSLVPAVVVTTP